MLTITFTWTKSTKNCECYLDEEERVLGTIYIKKDHFDGPAPKDLEAQFPNLVDPSEHL